MNIRYRVPIGCYAILLALAGCGAGAAGGAVTGYGESAAPGLAADMLNPQRPQAGPPFPYNTNGW
jgi:hypothetical protein